MGSGVDAVRDESPEHAAMIDNLKDQLLIVFLKRMGGEVSIPVEEIDDTGQDLFSFRVDQDKKFHFSLSKLWPHTMQPSDRTTPVNGVRNNSPAR